MVYTSKFCAFSPDPRSNPRFVDQLPQGHVTSSMSPRYPPEPCQGHSCSVGARAALRGMASAWRMFMCVCSAPHPLSHVLHRIMTLCLNCTLAIAAPTHIFTYPSLYLKVPMHRCMPMCITHTHTLTSRPRGDSPGSPPIRPLRFSSLSPCRQR
jgi:hypothetical protein